MNLEISHFSQSLLAWHFSYVWESKGKEAWNYLLSDGSLVKLRSLSCSSLEVNPQIKNYPKFFLNFLLKCSLPMSVPKNKIKKIGHRARSSPKGHCNSLSGPWLKNITVFLRAPYSPDNEFFLKRNTRCTVLYWGIILGVTGLEFFSFL